MKVRPGAMSRGEDSVHPKKERLELEGCSSAKKRSGGAGGSNEGGGRLRSDSDFRGRCMPALDGASAKKESPVRPEIERRSLNRKGRHHRTQEAAREWIEREGPRRGGARILIRPLEGIEIARCPSKGMSGGAFEWG